MNQHANPQRATLKAPANKNGQYPKPSPTGGGQGEGAPQTLDQQRAKLAWGYAKEGIKQYGSDYKNLAKGAPALIMGSGLMPTMAFYEGKGKAAHDLLDHLIRGLSERLYQQPMPTPGQGKKIFRQYMEALQGSSSQDYLRATDEALELLKWIRQFVDALGGDSNA